MIALPSSDDSRPDVGPLRQVIEAAAATTGLPLRDLTVLATQNDPYRLDTPANHRVAAWFAEHHAQELRDTGAFAVHVRGMHYALVVRGDVARPDGRIYENTDEDWEWLQGHPAKAARWLGYVPFNQIKDNRNAAPIKHRRSKPFVSTWIDVGVEISIPDADELEPRIKVTGFQARQPYHLVIFGEKSSLEDTVRPLARRYDADLYLGTGEISDTLIYEMAKDGAQDGRPMQVFTLSDCDPAGWQMVISIARKLQAFHDLEFPNLTFAIRPIALLPDQVRVLGLPSTPLKETERRADRWRAAFGVEQTEIDALDRLRPGALEEMVQAALRPFWDQTLEHRVLAASVAYDKAAHVALVESSDTVSLEAVRAQAVERLAEIEEEIEALNAALRQAVPDAIDLPPMEIPEPTIDENLHDTPLLSSDDDWEAATRALIERKRYIGGER